MAGEAATIQGIEFEIKGSATKASDSLKKLSDSLSSIKSTASGGIGLKSISKEIKDFANGLKEINAEKISSFKSAIRDLGKVKINSGFAKSIKEISDAISGLDSSKLSAISQTINSMKSGEAANFSVKGISSFQKAIETISAGSDGIGTVSQHLKAISELDFSNLSTAAQSIQSITSAASAISGGGAGGGDFGGDEESLISGVDFLGTAAKIAGKALSSYWGAIKTSIKKAAQITIPIIKSIAKEMLNLGKTSLTVGKNFAVGLGQKFIGQFTKPFANAISQISTFVKSIGRIAFYRAIRTLIKEITDAFKTGIDNLYQWSAVSGGEFASSMDRMATSMQYFKNSIGAAVAPLLNSLAPALDYVIDKVVDFINTINRLFAQLTGASYWTKALKTPIQYAEAARSAGSAAKEAMRYLAPFDELNVLPSDRGGGSGGGAGGADYSNMFEDVALERSAWIENIRDLMERGEWGLLGSSLAGKLNSIIDDWDAEAWGRRFGEAIQNGVDFAVALLSGLSTSRWGTKLADFINGLIDEIDPETIGELIALPLQKGIEFAFGFIQRIHWTSDEENIGIGAWLAGVVNGWFETIDFYLAGQTIHDAAVGMLEAVGEFLDGLTWEDVKVSFKNFWNGLNVGDIWDKFKALVTEKTGSVTFGEAIGKIAGKFGGIVGDIIDFLRGLPLKKIWKDFSSSLAKSLGYSSFSDMLSGLREKLTDIIRKAIKLVDWKELGYQIGVTIVDLLPDVMAAIGQLWSGGLQGVLDGLAEDRGLVGGIARLFGGQADFSDWHYYIDPYKGQVWYQGEDPRNTTPVGNGSGTYILDANTEGVSLNVTGRVTHLDDGLTKRQKATGLKGLTAHADRFGDSIKSTDKVVNNATAKMQTVQDDIPVSKKSIQMTAEFTSIIDSICDKLLRSFRADLTDKKDSISNKTLYSWTADLRSKADNISDRTVYGFNADLTTKVDSIKDKTISGVKALFSDHGFATSWKTPTPYSKALLNDWANYGISPWAYAMAYYNDWQNYGISPWAYAKAWYNDWGNYGISPWSYATAWFSGYNASTLQSYYNPWAWAYGSLYFNSYGKPSGGLVYLASGGVFSNGKWNPIQSYANGGFVGGQIFRARENGPELVGTLKGHTAVMNNDQIVASVSAGVARAISNIQFHMEGFGAATVPTYDQGEETEEMLYRAFVRALEETGLLVEIDNHIDLDGNQIYENVVRHNDAETRRLGRNRMLQRA